MLKNTQKPGHHGEAWEKTASENKQSQKTGSQRKDHEEKDQQIRQPTNDTKMQERQADQNLEGKKSKETGYDDPDPDCTENEVGEEDGNEN